MREAADLVNTFRQVVDAVQDQRVTFMAASVAYYAFVSLIPAILLLVAAANWLVGPAFAETVLDVTREFLTPAGQDTVATAIASAEGRTGATVAGVVVLLWSTLKVFRALDTAFLQVYGVDESVSFLRQLLDAFAVVIAIGLGFVVMIVVGALVAAVDSISVLEPIPWVRIAGITVLPLLLTVVFFPMYYLLPYPHVTLREALPGAVFAAIGWTTLQTGFQVYAAQAGQYQVYGVIGGVLLLVTWLYIAAIVVVVGAVINVVLASGRTVGFDADHEDGESPSASGSPADRQAQGGSERPRRMSERAEGSGVRSPHGPGDARERDVRDGDAEAPRGAPDVAALDEEVRRLRADLDEFERDIERRTVERPRLEAELKEYVRKRMRRGHARGWGPYLVLLYGVVLTLGAFYFQDGLYAIGAMLIVGLSTLGLYTLFVIVGIGLNAAGIPWRAIDYARDRKEE